MRARGSVRFMTLLGCLALGLAGCANSTGPTQAAWDRYQQTPDISVPTAGRQQMVASDGLGNTIFIPASQRVSPSVITSVPTE